jgi:hypothetical protein
MNLFFKATLVSSFLSLGLWHASTAQTSADSTAAARAMFLAAAKDQAMRDKLNALPNSSYQAIAHWLFLVTPVSQRREVKINAEPIPPDTSKTIPPLVTADVRLYSGYSTNTVSGSFVVTNIFPEEIRGTLKIRGGPPIGRTATIMYRLSKSASQAGLDLATLRTGAQFQITSFEDAYGLSQKRQLSVATSDSLPLLLYLSDGSNVLYRRALREVGLSIGQERVQDSAFVRITMGSQGVRLRSGERKTFQARGKTFEVFLLSNSMPAQQSIVSDGDPYSLRVMVYMIGGSSGNP